ncbi:MAG: hypothetical protein JSS81_06965 [Acidobacteria bacterium]|nr:hypothetical protein [Acidobacteriota bacterium]
MRFPKTTAALIFGIMASLFGCSDPTDRLEPVARKIRDGELKPDSEGVIRVPKELAADLQTGEIYFERRADGLTLILFPTWRGRGRDVEGYLYCSRELRAADFYAIDWGAGGVRQHLDVGPVKLLEVEPRRPHWYRAARRLD